MAGLPGGVPTLLELKTMKSADGIPLKVIQKIAAGDYMTFGMLLLQDDNGGEVTVIKRDHIHDGAERVTQAILIKWLTSGAPTRTYQHLIECLRQSELGTLADNISEMADYLIATPETVPTTQQCNPHVASYATYLREVYKYRFQSHTSQYWSHLPRCEFIQLAMIQGGKLRRGGPEEEMVRLAQQGRIETIMSHKTTIDLNSLLVTEQPLVVLPPPPPPPRVVLIEGPPGGGKSTLAFYICKQWAQGALFLSRFDLVVIAYLQDQGIQNASTLADILPANSFEMSQMVATQINRGHGHNVLFIFDGWDEFPPPLQNNSLVSTIIRYPQQLGVQQSTVIITSRPVASGNLLHIANRRVEILGFTQCQIREYIEKALDGNSTHIQKLVQHLENHPVIEGYCYIPLHAEILVYIFLAMKGVLPTTLHELFCSLVLCCIVRELETHESMLILPTLSSLDDLPKNLKSQLGYLSVLAYEGVLQDKVVFYQTDLEASHIPENLPSLGLLQAVEGLTLYSKSLSYNFLHLSVQELLAAYHISQMDPSKQVEVFNSLLASPRFHFVMQNYSGFTKLANPAIHDFISKYTRQQSSFDNILPFLHCFFEAHERSLCLLVDRKFRSIKLETNMNPVVFLSVGYFITSLLFMSTSDAPNEAHLELKSINDHQIKLLATELSKCPVGSLSTTGALPWRLGIDLHHSHITKNGVKLIISFLEQSPPLVTELSLHDGDIQRDKDFLVYMAEKMLANSYFTRLQLKNMNIHMHKQNDDALMLILLKNRSLTHLDLSSNQLFSNTGADGFFQVLQYNKTLVHLDLSYTGLEDRMSKALAEMLQVNKSLTHLNLSSNRCFSDSGIQLMLHGLKHNTTLISLNLSVTGMTDKGAVYIAEILDSNCPLQTLDISYNRIGGDGFASIAKSLMSSTIALNHLYISFTATNATAKVEAIHAAREENRLRPITVTLIHPETVGKSPVDPETAMESPVDPEIVKESIKVTVTMRIIKIEAQGYPGTGKTSLLNLAMGEDPASTRDSTDFVEPPSRYMVSEASGGKWEKLSTDKILEGISTEVKKVNKQDMEASMEYEQSIVEDKASPPTVSMPSVSTQALTEISQPPSVSAKLLASFPIEHVLTDTTHPPESVSTQALTEISQPSPQPLTSISQQLQSNESSINELTDTTQPTLPPHHEKSNPYLAIASDLIKAVGSIKHSTEIFSLKWVIVSDCGGQPPFLDAAALFLRNSSLRIIPLKLSDLLDACADMSYFVGGNNCLTDSYVPLTNLQTIETFAKSVAAIQSLCTTSTEGAQEGRTCTCKFTIIGTFEDKEHESESVEKKEEILKQVLRPYEFFQVCGDRFILPINAVIQPGPERDKAAEDLRKLIESSEIAREFKVKLRWFLFLLGMMNKAEEKKKAVFSKDDECFELGKTLGMEKGETIEAIKFFHDIGLMMHFDGDLEDYVVVDDEPVLQKISQLLSVSFFNRKDFNKFYTTRNGARKQRLKSFFSETPEGSTPLSKYMQQNLQEYGRFHRRYLEFLNLTEKELDFFLKMLVHVNAIAETKNEEYFMPCALPYEKEPEPPNEFPWIVRFRMKVERAGVSVDKNYIPPPVGYLPALVVFLVTKFSSGFTYPPGNERQYRNYITLAYKTDWRVYIIEHHLQLEFYFSGGYKSEAEFSIIRHSILDAISKTKERLQIADGVERIDCFFCTCRRENSSSSIRRCHICVCQENGRSAVCEESHQSRDLESENLHWMKATGQHQTDWTEPVAVTCPQQTDSAGANIQPVIDPAYCGDRTNQEVAGLKEDLSSNTGSSHTTDFSSTLSIDDLAQIKMFLKNVNNWRSLGLQLGLLQPTLERIEEDQRGINDRCKTEMLTAWLKRKDNVAVIGVPCCAVLKAALEKIDENQVASEINLLLREMIMLRRRKPKLSSIIHDNSWWIIVVLSVLLAVGAAFYKFY